MVEAKDIAIPPAIDDIANRSWTIAGLQCNLSGKANEMNMPVVVIARAGFDHRPCFLNEVGERSPAALADDARVERLADRKLGAV